MFFGNDLLSLLDEVGTTFGQSRRGERSRALGPGAAGGACRVRSDKDGVRFAIDLPGYDKDAVAVEIEQDRLTVRASRNSEEYEDLTAIRSERGARSWERSFTLPYPVDEEQAKASYADGVLVLDLKPSGTVGPRKIAIEHN